MNKIPVKVLCLSYLLLGQAGCLRRADEFRVAEKGEAQQCESGEGGALCVELNDCDEDSGEGCAPCDESPDGCPDLNFIRVEGGSFMMGSAEGASNEQPVRSVSVAAFEITATEVTVAQYRTCVEAGRCTQPTASHEACTWDHNQGQLESYPINCIDWGQARTFAKWLGADVDLPTEAE